ncbi:hypothetical protein KEM52_000011 [Ascosphaera acerosa]|nr:hypothetical protein KEM52_000011 [Ascosphaera acerosa]
MAAGLLKPAILIVSDTAALDASCDHTGPALTQVLSSITGSNGDRVWDDPDIAIVPDLVSRIQMQIKKWTEKTGSDRVNLIMTSGGTGFAVRDRTPEARDAHGISTIHSM